LDDYIAIHVKGMELPGYDPRSSIGYALAYAIADRGGCHRRARPILKEAGDDAYRFAYDGKAQLVRRLEDERGFYHSLIVCDFIPRVQSVSMEEYASLLNLATGGDYDEKAAMRIGERAMNLSRLFNLRCGFSRDEDRLPERFFKEKMPRGGAEGSVLDKSKFKKMVQEYYAERGWGNKGFPSQAKLRELDINDFTVEENHAS
jgi:aldehyde:ferredoxin oxidoreductase